MRKLAFFWPFAIVLLGSAHWLAAQPKLDSTELFGVYENLISDSPLSKADFETLKPTLREQGFTTPDGIYWSMGDASGTVFIVALPGSGMFSVKYITSTPSTFGDAALAALISKAENIEIGDGDKIVITLHTRTLSKDHRTGSKMEYLIFNLQGGFWRESGVHIDWK